MATSGFWGELRRRNVLRAAVLYAGAMWAFGQGLSQFSPALGLSDYVTRWFLIAAIVGFPFWLAFAWFYEFTPAGFKCDDDVAPDAPIRHSNARKLDVAIIGVMAIAIVLLASGYFINRPAANGAVAAVPGKSVAVLPMINESGDVSEDYFSDGLSEELISALGQVRDLKVIGRNSSFQFRGSAQTDAAGIGAKLNVATLLEGTVRKQGNEVRIVVSLIRTSDGSQLWSQTYDRQLKDVFAVQSNIATSVADALKAAVFGQPVQATDIPPNGNMDAYDAMLEGRYYAARRTRADYRKAVRYYQRAIELDPDYALAYARLAIAEQWFNDWEANASEREGAGAQARSNVRKAVELAPQSAVALGALGINQAWTDFDYPAAQATLKKAVALDPSNAETLYQLADVTACLGRTEEAVAIMRKALALEPLNASFHFYSGTFLLALGRYAEGQKETQRALELQPGADGYSGQLALALMDQGRFDQAIAAAKADPNEPDRLQSLALIWYARGDKRRAAAVLKDFVRRDGKTSPGLLAEVFAYEGDLDQAFALLDRAVQDRDPSAASIYEAPFDLEALHGDPRFAAFCRKIGLPTPREVAAQSGGKP